MKKIIDNFEVYKQNHFRRILYIKRNLQKLFKGKIIFIELRTPTWHSAIRKFLKIPDSGKFIN